MSVDFSRYKEIIMKKECTLLDVFTDSPFSGNQLAVFPKDSAFLIGTLEQSRHSSISFTLPALI